MGEHFVEREILIRISKIEQELANKELRIAELEGAAEHFIQTENLLREELRQKDQQIASLSQHAFAPAGENNGGPTLASLPSLPGEDVNMEKSHHDLLIKGDSAIKHCQPENILPGKDTHISCPLVPGQTKYRPNMRNCRKIMYTTKF